MNRRPVSIGKAPKVVWNLIIKMAKAVFKYAVWIFSAMLQQLNYPHRHQVDKAIYVGYSSEVLSYQRFVGKPGDGKRSG